MLERLQCRVCLSFPWALPIILLVHIGYGQLMTFLAACAIKMAICHATVALVTVIKECSIETWICLLSTVFKAE